MNILGFLLMLIIVILLESVDNPLFPTDNIFPEYYFQPHKVDIMNWLQHSLIKTSHRWLALTMFYYFLCRILKSIVEDFLATFLIFVLGIATCSLISLACTTDLDRTIPVTDHILTSARYMFGLFILSWALCSVYDLFVRICSVDGVASLVAFWLATFLVHSASYVVTLTRNQHLSNGTMPFAYQYWCGRDDDAHSMTVEVGGFDQGCNMD